MSVLTMPNSLDGLGKKAANITAILVLMGVVVGFLDIRHAKSGDFQDLKAAFHYQEVQDIEDEIAVIEDDIYVIERENILTNREIAQVSKLKNRKAKYLRRLSDISPR